MRPFTTRAVAVAAAALMTGGLLAAPTPANAMAVTPPVFTSSGNLWEWAEAVDSFGSTSEEEARTCANRKPIPEGEMVPPMETSPCSARAISPGEAFFAHIVLLLGRLTSSIPR